MTVRTPIALMQQSLVTPFQYGNDFQVNKVNPLSANPTKWSDTLKRIVLSVFDHFVGLTLTG